MSAEHAPRLAQSGLRRYLARASAPTFTLVAVGAAFSAYFSMYALRKPFAAASYGDDTVLGLQLKIAFVIAQVLGYAGSKFLAVRFVSEIPRARRAVTLLGLVALAQLALLAFAVLPPGGQVFAMWLNGLPLGAVWGLVFSFLEGRRTSELLGAGLSMSYIVASGAVKSVGRLVLDTGVPVAWMPATVGLMFLPVLAGCVYVLHCLPAPDGDDERARSPRAAMGARARRAFFREHRGGLLALCALYVLLTAYRDFRDNFAVELWAALGVDDSAGVLTFGELPIAALVMLALALVFRIPDNRRALLVVHAMVGGGTLLIGLSTLLMLQGVLPGGLWMVLVGVGLYLGYVPYGCVLFDRLMAMTRSPGTAVFMINLTDALGYLGSVGLLLYRNFGSARVPDLGFFIQLSLWTAGLCTLGVLVSARYFLRRDPAPA